MVSLIVGLGNPGAKYEKTRHNAGFFFADSLVKAHGAAFSENAKFHGDIARIGLQGRSVMVLKPKTFMNRSGQSVAAVCRYFEVGLDELLVVHDELDIEPGQVRLKQGGGHGGHNGLRDIMSHMGGQNFYRFRIGIGHPGDRSQVTHYVLSAPSKSELQSIDMAIQDAVHCVPALVEGRSQAVMQSLHTTRRVDS